MKISSMYGNVPERRLKAAFNDIVVGEEDSGAGSIAQCVNAILEKEGINISVSASDLPGGETPKQILLQHLKGCKLF